MKVNSWLERIIFFNGLHDKANQSYKILKPLICPIVVDFNDQKIIFNLVDGYKTFCISMIVINTGFFNSNK
ncbi:hypothetical protein IW15_10385 [Chryseobacterium soli]|uniref:Uncharacterized protein n=1 Tax=Chryseobacterium soli TaxID=445961 RepID=A0A086A8Z1_9FLAO|nr:hypothetical protein IW15_10385 [Chryseobacterium soli]